LFSTRQCPRGPGGGRCARKRLGAGTIADFVGVATDLDQFGAIEDEGVGLGRITVDIAGPPLDVRRETETGGEAPAEAELAVAVASAELKGKGRLQAAAARGVSIGME